MLFDDDEQLEVRHVVSLAHHDISIYSGEPVTPEGELWIKRNAIRLSRRTDGPELGPDSQVSKPFYLFSENCSAKEDFYFALLRDQEQTFGGGNKAPTPVQFDVKNMISLVQKLHSSEEHLQTRWLNAMIGRIFLGIHKTKDVESFIREKLTKKISRVKRPAFLSNISIKGIDTGESAPYITNPRLKDLTVEGECGMEADVRYTGNFRLEVAATARIDLGSRFKPREVNLLLAVVVRRLEGHALFKIKPPPSNRIWFSFQQMPKMEMTIEPIVSSRQITYTVILRQIENRIKEVIAETIVLPFWDDMPFFSTENKKWRGGIFHDDSVKSSADQESAVAQEPDLGEVERIEDANVVQETELPRMEKSHSVPVLEKKPSTGLFGKKLTNKPSKTDLESSSSASVSASATSIEAKDTTAETMSPPPVLSATFAQPSSPTVGTIATTADQFKPSCSPSSGSSAVSVIATLSAKSQSPPPPQNPSSNAFKPYVTSKSSSHSFTPLRETADAEKEANKAPQGRRNTVPSAGNPCENGPRSPSLSDQASICSQTTPTTEGPFPRHETTSTSSGSSHQNANESHKRTALAAVANAAASAKRWGLQAFQRKANGQVLTDHGQRRRSPTVHDLSQPMGRGHPLPPPGVPLPMPGSKTQIPKRKPIPQRSADRDADSATQKEHSSVPDAILPKRHQDHGEQIASEDGMLVVAAPADSSPSTPQSTPHSSPFVRPQVGDAGESDDDTSSAKAENTAQLGNDAGPGAPLVAMATEETQQGEAERLPEPSGDDEDEYSAWMDNSGTEESRDHENVGAG